MKVIEQLLFILIIFGFSIIIIFSLTNHKLAIYITIFCLPFTQAPTLKLLARWRISEVLAWLYLPLHLSALRRLVKQMPAPVFWFLFAMIGYFFYTGLIGVTRALFVEVKINKAVEYTLSPFLRTILETARGLASISLFIGMLIVVYNWVEFHRVIKLFVWSGAVSGGYGVYQAAVLALKLPLPLLPETLYQEGFSRPFGTFYEPTGMGSFTATTLLFSLYLLFTEPKLLWLVCFILNGLGFFVSLSRAGWAGLIAGGCVLLLALMWHKRNPFLSIFAAIILTGALWLCYLAGLKLFGEQTLQFALSRYWLEYSMRPRVEGYNQLPSLLNEFLYGFGQGLFLFYGGGAPGLMRLLIEGGLVGAFCLALLHINSIRCLLHLWTTSFEQTREFLPFLLASYVSSIIIILNYINVTDMWIWFVWSLPAVALWSAAKTERTRALS